MRRDGARGRALAQQSGAGIIRDPLQLLRREAPVQRHQRGADPLAGEEAGEHPGMIQPDPADAVPGADSLAAQQRLLGVDQRLQGGKVEALHQSVSPFS